MQRAAPPFKGKYPPLRRSENCFKIYHDLVYNVYNVYTYIYICIMYRYVSYVYIIYIIIFLYIVCEIKNLNHVM